MQPGNAAILPARTPLQCGIHWIELTSRLKPHQVAKAAGRALLGMDTEDSWLTPLDVGIRGYEQRLEGPDGLAVWFTPNRDDCHLIFPGDCCDQAPIARLLELIQLDQTKLTRCDLKLDGVDGPDGRKLDPEWIADMIEDTPDMIRTRAKIERDPNLPADQQNNGTDYRKNKKGKTVYIGSRHSERMLRIYDARGFCRMELEVKADKANELQLILTPENLYRLPEFVIGCIRGFCDFVEPGYTGHKDRAPLQAWWKEVVDHVERITLSVEQPDPDIIRMWSWLKHISANYYTAIAAAGGDVDAVTQLLTAEGEKKFSGRHKQMLASAKDWIPS